MKGFSFDTREDVVSFLEKARSVEYLKIFLRFEQLAGNHAYEVLREVLEEIENDEEGARRVVGFFSALALAVGYGNSIHGAG